MFNRDETGIVMPTENITHNNNYHHPSAKSTEIEPASKSKSSKTLTIALGSLGVLAALVLGGSQLFGNNSVKFPELEQAEAKAATGEYAQAIALVRDLKPTDKIQQQVDLWSEQLFNQAQTQYDRQGDIETARRKIESIPDGSELKTEATELLSNWEEEHEYNQSILQIATDHLQQEQWQNAKTGSRADSGRQYLLERNSQPELFRLHS